MHVPKIRRLGGVCAVRSEGVNPKQPCHQICGGSSGSDNCDSVFIGCQIFLDAIVCVVEEDVVMKILSMSRGVARWASHLFFSSDINMQTLRGDYIYHIGICE
jgi:hypothetical protein